MNNKALSKAKILLIGIMFVVVLPSCGISKKLPNPAVDISSLPYADLPPVADNYVNSFIGGIEYEAYVPMDPFLDPEQYNYCLADCFSQGEPCAYFINNDRYIYFCMIEGLDPAQWLLELTDDGQGRFSYDEARIVKAVDTTEIPSWIEAARKAYMNKQEPGSYTGLAEGCTQIPNN